jgi:hypothetical protein
MLKPSLGARPPITRPASDFPERANIYVCDNCGTDITKHFRPGQSHVWRPMGPERYQCLCGKKYLTGAAEWDDFSRWERSGRIRYTLGMGLTFSTMISVLGLMVYLVLKFAFGVRAGAVGTGLIITALPFCLMQFAFWPSVFASMWRTRIASRVEIPTK